MRNDEINVLFPLLAGSTVALCTILIHSLALGASVNLFRRERNRGRVGSGLLADLGIFVLTISLALAAHLTEIGLWALLFVLCGSLKSYELAYYISAGNYTTLGSGDLTLTSPWKLLCPLEAADGALMFGVSTALIFAIAQRLMRAKYGDLSG